MCGGSRACASKVLGNRLSWEDRGCCPCRGPERGLSDAVVA